MREHGILFKAEMVRAILDGRKTVTRRLVKWRMLPGDERTSTKFSGVSLGRAATPSTCAAPVASGARSPSPSTTSVLVCQSPWKPGDRLWVRETWGLHQYGDFTCWLRDSIRGRTEDDIRMSWEIAYAADATSEHDYWRPSLLMPRWASRITLEVVSVRVEHLQAITEEDARAEGVSADDIGRVGVPCYSARQNFERLWASINGPESWDANPWVWRIEFRRLP